MAFPLTSEAPQRKRVYSTRGFLLIIKQRKTMNHEWYRPGCQLFPRFYLLQEANWPLATTVPLSRTHFSGLRLTMKKYTISSLTCGTSLAYQRKLFQSSSNFKSPPLTTQISLFSPSPLFWVAFHTHAWLNQSLDCVPSGESGPIVQQCLSASKARGQGVEGDTDIPRVVIFKGCHFPFLLARRNESWIFNLKTEEGWVGVGDEKEEGRGLTQPANRGC